MGAARVGARIGLGLRTVRLGVGLLNRTCPSGVSRAGTDDAHAVGLAQRASLSRWSFHSCTC